MPGTMYVSDDIVNQRFRRIPQLLIGYCRYLQVYAPYIRKKPPPQEKSILTVFRLLSMQGKVFELFALYSLSISIEEERKLINRFYPDASFVRGFFHAVQGLFVRTGPSSTSANPMIFNLAKCCYRKSNNPLPVNGKNSCFPA